MQIYFAGILARLAFKYFVIFQPYSNHRSPFLNLVAAPTSGLASGNLLSASESSAGWYSILFR